MNVILHSTSMRSKPIETSKLETECLFGEKVKILGETLEWYFCVLKTDNYHGWVKKKHLGYSEINTHRVISKRSFIYKNKNIKSNCIDYLPLGALLSIKKIEDKWAHIFLTDAHNQKIAYVPTNHVVEIENIVKDWVSISEQLLETPYKWGGRDSIGLDCSALLQLSYQAYGQNIPRNTSDQIKLLKKTVIDVHKLERGFVIFWKGHVGIMVDKINCIHANAFHMKVITEPLNDIIIRMGKKDEIIKILDFNKLNSSM